MNEAQKYLHKYNKESSDHYFILSIIFAVLIFIIGKPDISLYVFKILIIIVLILTTYSNFKKSYYDDMYYSYLCDGRDKKEKYLKTYLRIKKEKSKFKRFIISIFSLGILNAVKHIFIALLMLGAIIILLLIW